MHVQQRGQHNSYWTVKGLSGLAPFAGHCCTGISDDDYESHIRFSQCTLDGTTGQLEAFNIII